MEKGINYWAFPPEPDGGWLDPALAIRRARDLGFDCLEFTLDDEGPFSVSSPLSAAEALRREAERAGLRLRTVASKLSWSRSPSDPDPAVRDQAVADVTRCLDLTAALGAETFLYVPGLVSSPFVPNFVPQRYDRVLERATESLNRLIPVAAQVGVRLAVENVWNRFLLSPLEMRDFIDSFKSPWIGAYFDVGNVMLYGYPEHWIELLGGRILAIHMKDFRVAVGTGHGFVDLLDGDVDYAAVMAACAATGFIGPFVAEILPGRLGSIEKAAAALRVIEAKLTGK
jgi:hexulose-6-phosphate isomerase